jgi:predicted RNA-binding Zn-ribbon protein involved in translation (DUF1610 family)
MPYIKLKPVVDTSVKDLSKAVGKLTTPLPGEKIVRYLCGHCDEELLSHIEPLEEVFLFICPKCQRYSENETK